MLYIIYSFLLKLTLLSEQRSFSLRLFMNNINLIKMKRILALMSFQCLKLPFISAQDKFTADTAQTKILWLGEKVTGQHTGTIKLNSGWLNWMDNKIVSGEFNIDMTSLKDSEANERLEGHLKSDDFFGVEKFPVIKTYYYRKYPF